MIHRLLGRRVVYASIVCVGAFVVLAPKAKANLIVETRYEGRSDNGPLKPGDILNFGVYVAVTGSDNNPNNEGLRSLQGSFVSQNINGGVLRGDLTATPLSPFDANGAYGGDTRDIDGDGDLDIGGYIPDGGPSTGTGYFAVRASKWQFLNANKKEFKIADLSLNVTSVLDPQPEAATIVQFTPTSRYYGDYWQSDGQFVSLYQQLFNPDDVQTAGWTTTPLDVTSSDAPPGVFAARITIVPEPSLTHLIVLSLMFYWVRRNPRVTSI